MGQYEKDVAIEDILKKVLEVIDLKNELDRCNNYVLDLSEGNDAKSSLPYYMLFLGCNLIVTACCNALDYYGIYLLFNIITLGTLVKNVSLIVSAIKYNKYKSNEISVIAPKIDELETKINSLEKEIKCMRDKYSNKKSNINFIEPMIFDNNNNNNYDKNKTIVKKRILQKDK